MGHLPAPSLDVPVLQMVDQLPDIEHFFAALSPDPEQVIEVPKILPLDVPMRTAPRDTQLVEQLVEVPTIISCSSLQPSSFSEAFKAFLKDQVQKREVELPVDFPVPGGGGPSSGLQGFFSGLSSTAVFGAENVDTPAPHARGGVSREASPRDRVQQPFVELTLSTLLFLTVVEEVLVEVFKASLRDRAHQRFVEQKMSTFPFLMVVLEREVFTVFPEDKVPQHLLLSRPSVLIVEVLMVFLVDRVPQRLPSSRLFLRLLIDRCHKPRFMAVMTSGSV